MWENTAARPLWLSEEGQIDTGDSIDLDEPLTPNPWTAVQIVEPQCKSVRYGRGDECQIDTGDSIDLDEELTPNPWPAIQGVEVPLVPPTPSLLRGDTR